MAAPKINFPSEDSPQRASSSKSLRPKVPLKPGRSLMDWIRLGNSGKDLAGAGGKIQKVSAEELAKHNKANDVWIAVRGKVYNITSYLDYHPGGIPEIMKGAGIDATELFDEIHKWVNAESMLSKCLIGPLVSSGRVKRKPPRTGSGLSSNSVASLAPNHLTAGTVQIDGFRSPAPPINPNLPRYDWYQNDKIVTITVYTRKKGTKQEDIILELREEKDFDAVITLSDKCYRIHLELEHRVSNQQVRVQDETDKLDILLTKAEPGTLWSDLGKPSSGHQNVIPVKSQDSRFWDCRIHSVEQVTHNVKLFCLGFPDGVQMRTPVGRHVHIKKNIEGVEITRSYTVVLPSLQVDPSERECDGKRFYLMIKIYPHGTVTPSFQSLVPGDLMTTSDYTGDFEESRLLKAKELVLIAAGTGFTPMVRLIRTIIIDNPKSTVTVKLFFANQEEKDIIWKNQLDSLVETSNHRFQAFYTVSKPSADWEGYEGRINIEMLLQVLPPPPGVNSEQDLLICICGPDPFTHGIISMLKDLGYTTKMIHAFLG